MAPTDGAAMGTEDGDAAAASGIEIEYDEGPRVSVRPIPNEYPHSYSTTTVPLVCLATVIAFLLLRLLHRVPAGGSRSYRNGYGKKL